MALSEDAKDRVAERVHRAIDCFQGGHPAYWRGGEPERKMSEDFAELTAEESHYAIVLVEQLMARLDERGSDPVLERINRCRRHSGTSVSMDEES